MFLMLHTILYPCKVMGSPPLQLSSPLSPAVEQRSWYQTSHTGEDNHLLVSNLAPPLESHQTYRTACFKEALTSFGFDTAFKIMSGFVIYNAPSYESCNIYLFWS
ncbi:hypothetical protein HanPSC8_Chr12g0515891 [Helianthus annuus]|nr:hypothetical protein HanPSC8_Chr12g0515891 [Helianthus annuus]